MPVRIQGLDEFRRNLRQTDRRLPKALQKANKSISVKTVDKAKPAVQGLSSPGGAKALPGIRPTASQKAATISLLGSNPTVRANILGTLSHTVFGRTIPGRGPWLPWVGRSWQPEELHGLGPAIQNAKDTFILDEYLEAILEGLGAAFD